jgi:oligopeptide transport system permease protein
VRTAASKGLAPGTVLRRHVLPNVWPALLDAIGPVATSLLAGSFAAERVFGLPYFGQLYVLAVLQKQVAVVVVATTVFASLLVIVGLVIEVLRFLVDPRAREARP